MMPYEDALQAWGAQKLNEDERKVSDYFGRPAVEHRAVDIDVSFEFSEGYACCGGSNPECYCSMAESPRAGVVIRDLSWQREANVHHKEIEASQFDFAQVIYELVMAGGGAITAEAPGAQ